MASQKYQRVQKARAIVIRENNAGESNKRLTLLAKDKGKLTVFAKGAKNPKSKYLSGAQAFCYCDFVLYDGGSFQSVTQADLIRNFSVYYNDIEKMMYGSYFLELIDKTVMLSQESNDIMLLLLKGLHMLEATDSPKRISAAFQLKLFDLLGVCPDTVCVSCGGRATGKGLYYSQEGFSLESGFLCGDCRKPGQKRASDGAVMAVDYIKAAESAGKAFMFSVGGTVLEELNDMAEMIVKSQIEADINSLDIIKSL